jgi:hypothetical protein
MPDVLVNTAMPGGWVFFDDDRQRFVSSAGFSFFWHRVLVLGSVASCVLVNSQVRVLLLIHWNSALVGE